MWTMTEFNSREKSSDLGRLDIGGMLQKQIFLEKNEKNFTQDD
jgi:hypothetical protein